MKYTAADIDRYIDLYLNSFEKVLYEEDSQFMEGMKTRSLAGDDIRRYQFWEWTQGVGLYGVWKLYKETKDERNRRDESRRRQRGACVHDGWRPLRGVAAVGEADGEAQHLRLLPDNG